jgi:hypothetical protein
MRDKLRAILPATVSTRVVAFAATACHGRPVGLVGLPGPRVRPVTQSVNQFCHTVVAGLPTFLPSSSVTTQLGGRLYMKLPDKLTD